ncbi:putative F-box protein At1g58310 [Papaver somniferum]|uniref:putative F-box protein At1g58310 n=1 Tax=Papaver somniferum TaxID=3469 RepID=UPI000E6FDC3A|nr:putative F-box protein At1g58310 [Papaver somniferum]XP_026444939.1 putative F-box protein At1g58310 [Papaver somniferum]XP_026444940.1 putative F-box protein At1g58310 [Papaver somniferum]XP_026444941.1 putative F-box protein At1g58310 [Papaver somniferum]XP_026444942.1 putative F-box protein At1g58310 [Papaver somniferum]XP_026444943.1 putative F-box protein At1g58310 [Papaver somniferum]XP_026444944.1 putative F-box protein At1g58310 [Papaver somniferum]XP_026444945.1 putative F-box pr
MDLINGKLMKGQNSVSGAEEDRISLLPDSLLHYIISFLDNKCVARTSLLSKRWSHIWTSIPTLDFQFPDNSSETTKFMDFVDRTLLLHDFSSIKKFSLHWFWSENHLNACKINSWISAVKKHKVEEISIFLHQLLPGSIPLALFTSKSLVTLELNIQPNICLPVYISFPMLKRLKLCEVKFSDEWSNGQLFSSFPVLEDLVLECCTSHMKNFCISIPALKLLTFENHYEQEDCLKDCSLRIHAPSLVFLTYLSGVPKEFILSAFPTLVEAEVSFLVDEDCYG